MGDRTTPPRWTRREALGALAAAASLPATRLHGEPRSPATATDPAREPLPFVVAPAQPDALSLLSPAAIRLGGWLGARVDRSVAARLARVDTGELLAPFLQRPGAQAWIGEHIGKWMHAATLAWANTGRADLAAKLASVSAALAAAQEPDGYLGTYAPGRRMGLYPDADWDVWTHKYCLLGLLTYHRYSGDATALAVSRRAADFLLATFPARGSILSAGTHVGMAATSVLEPMVLLYRITGDPRYLEFAHYLVRAWDEPQGPAIARDLLAGRPVDGVADGKAYELLSNLVGLVELARVSGDANGLRAAQRAWDDIVAHRLTLSGTASQWEHFQPQSAQRLDVGAHVGETCVTTTWIQLNLALLQVTGDARYACELERSYYNHLTAAQHPAGADWCYYTPLQGRKRYQSDTTCCHSSGPRALALAPQTVYLRGDARTPDGVTGDLLAINTCEASRATVVLDGIPVEASLHSPFPASGVASLTLHMPRAARFALRVRRPGWAVPGAATASRRGARSIDAQVIDGWWQWPVRRWQDGDRIRIPLEMGVRPLHRAGDWPAEAGRWALGWGPFVLALDTRSNPSVGALHDLAWSTPDSPAAARLDGDGLPIVDVAVRASNDADSRTLQARPFADSGVDRSLFRIALLEPGRSGAPGDSVLWGAQASQSRPGRALIDGVAIASARPSCSPIVDDDEASEATTLSDVAAGHDWFAVALPAPVLASRVVFVQGNVTPDGGWFDVESGGRPRVQVQSAPGDDWQTVGELRDYPATTATDAAELTNTWDAHEYTLRFDEPRRFIALRIVGAPGGPAATAHVRCRELRAYRV